MDVPRTDYNRLDYRIMRGTYSYTRLIRRRAYREQDNQKRDGQTKKRRDKKKRILGVSYYPVDKDRIGWDSAVSILFGVYVTGCLLACLLFVYSF